MASTKVYDFVQADCREFLKAINPFDVGCAEIRVFNADWARGFIVPVESYRKVFSGWYDNPVAATHDAHKFQGASAYVTVNPIHQDLLARSHNAITKTEKGCASKDSNVVCVRWAYFDIDSRREKGISATQGEVDATVELRNKVLDENPALRDSAIWGCSGNGSFILLRLDDLPNDADTSDLISRLIDGMAAKYDNAAAFFDKSSKFPSHVMCLPGTMKCKGSDTEKRPWRIVSFDSYVAGHTTTPTPFTALGKFIKSSLPVVAAKPSKGSPKKKGDKDDKVAKYVAPWGSLSVAEKAKRCIMGMADSIEGQEGHKQLLAVAITLHDGFGLNREECFQLFSEWNAVKAHPPESDYQLHHKLDEAEKKFPVPRLKELNDPKYMRQAPATTIDPVTGETIEEMVEIGITTEMHEVISHGCYALGSDSNVYQRATLLVTVLRDAASAWKLSREVAMPSIVPLVLPRVRELLSKNAYWFNWKPSKEGELEKVAAIPPMWAAQGVFSRGEWPSVRPIETVIESPILRPDGSIFNTPGYDEHTGILFESDREFFDVPENPSASDAREAAARLYELVADFPMKSATHRAAWLAALLTPFARWAIKGACPLFLFDANGPGSGKTLLADIIAIISTGRPMARTTYPDSDEEMRKRITSIALGGDRLALIDNIVGLFGGQSMDAAITGTMWKDRVLGKTEMTREMSLFVCWYATGNNVQIRGDGLRRIIPCRLETTLERPEDRTDFEHPDIVNHVSNNRSHYIRDVLTILRGFHVAGCPQMHGKSLGTFEAWSNLIRACVFWVSGIDPCETREELRTLDPEMLTLTGVIEGWGELPNGTSGITTAQALDCLRIQTTQYSTLRSALLEWSRGDDLLSPRSLGMKLKQVKGRVINGKSLHSVAYQGTQKWSVRQVESVVNPDPRPNLVGLSDSVGPSTTSNDWDDLI